MNPLLLLLLLAGAGGLLLWPWLPHRRLPRAHGDRFCLEEPWWMAALTTLVLLLGLLGAAYTVWHYGRTGPGLEVGLGLAGAALIGRSLFRTWDERQLCFDRHRDRISQGWRRIGRVSEVQAVRLDPTAPVPLALVWDPASGHPRAFDLPAIDPRHLEPFGQALSQYLAAPLWKGRPSDSPVSVPAAPSPPFPNPEPVEEQPFVAFAAESTLLAPPQSPRRRGPRPAWGWVLMGGVAAALLVGALRGRRRR